MARTIPKRVLEDIRFRCDIVDVIGSAIELKRAGSAFKALCPFHKEKTPSFMVNPERQTFHCFGCGKGGDVFRFIMEIEGVSFPEALRTLAARAGIRLPERGDPKTRETREKLYELLDFAAGAYRALYRGAAGAKAREYARSRGFDEETEERFSFGFAPDAWRTLRDGALRKGWTDDDLVRAGLVECVLDLVQDLVDRGFDVEAQIVSIHLPREPPQAEGTVARTAVREIEVEVPVGRVDDRGWTVHLLRV